MSDKCRICGEQVQYLPSHLKRHKTTIVEYGKNYPQWVSFTTAPIDFRMTPNQLLEAVKLNLVKSKDPPNADNTETVNKLVITEDIAKNYQRIKKLPKFSIEEIERREIYLNRKREEMMQRLSFYCPRCKENVAPPMDSLILQLAMKRKMTLEEACENSKISHYRHVHTDYESEIINFEEKVEASYFEEVRLKHIKYNHESLEAFKDTIKYTKQKTKIKTRYSEEAKRLIQENFIPQKDKQETKKPFEENKSGKQETK